MPVPVPVPGPGPGPIPVPVGRYRHLKELRYRYRTLRYRTLRYRYSLCLLNLHPRVPKATSKKRKTFCVGVPRRDIFDGTRGRQPSPWSCEKGRAWRRSRAPSFSMPPAARGKLAARGAAGKALARKPSSMKGAAGAAGAAAATGAAGAAVAAQEESSDEESEEESEEAQVCWSAIFSFLPLIWTIASEFAAEAMEAGICQHLALLMLPVVTAFKSLVESLTGPPAPPAMAPPAPPPPPVLPDIVTRMSVATFTYAEAHPVYYLLLDFSIAVAVGIFFLFLKDITDWIEEQKAAARQKEAGEQQSKYEKVEEEETPEEEKPEDPTDVDFDSEAVKSAQGIGLRMPTPRIHPQPAHLTMVLRVRVRYANRSLRSFGRPSRDCRVGARA